MSSTGSFRKPDAMAVLRLEQRPYKPLYTEHTATGQPKCVYGHKVALTLVRRRQGLTYGGATTIDGGQYCPTFPATFVAMSELSVS